MQATYGNCSNGDFLPHHASAIFRLSPRCLCFPCFESCLARGSPRRLGRHLLFAVRRCPRGNPCLRLAFRLCPGLIALGLRLSLLRSASQRCTPPLLASNPGRPRVRGSCGTLPLCLCDGIRFSLPRRGLCLRQGRCCGGVPCLAASRRRSSCCCCCCCCCCCSSWR
jgi:hypothetical protein